MGDFSDYRDRNGNLIPIYDPLQRGSTLRAESAGIQFPQ